MRLYDNDAYREEFMELVYDLLRDDGTNDRANQIIAAFDSAPEVEAEPLQPNDPLTLEELREMDGEPVWIESPCIPNGGRYIILSDLGITFEKWTSQKMFHCENYGNTWLAYRRKPEEVQQQ